MAKLLALFLLTLLLTACETVNYYRQAVAGQFYILMHRQDLNKVIADARTPPQLREKLTEILAIRAFAEQELSLPVDSNFSTYVDVQRAYAVWTVFATPEFSMQPEQWCYPLAGCVSYRGYFKGDDARDFAGHLAEENYDVYLGGVAAYSTLGWFSDPVLNTVMARDEYQLARLVFHELAHQVVYIPGDTEFNESFASAVEAEGLRRWLQRRQPEEADSARILKSVKTDIRRQEEFVELVQATVSSLENLYGADMAPAAMRLQKQALLQQLREDYEILKADWDGYSGYDNWFSQDMNNAQLITVATYFRWVPAFEALLLEQNGDLVSFYERVRTLSRLSVAGRAAQLNAEI